MNTQVLRYSTVARCLFSQKSVNCICFLHALFFTYEYKITPISTLKHKLNKAYPYNKVKQYCPDI